MKKNKGFTLIELLVVVAIIGLLSAVVLVSLNSARKSAYDAKRKADLKQIANAFEMYYDTNSQYPTISSDLCSYAGSDGCSATTWTPAGISVSTWLSTLPNDPAQNATYYYRAKTNSSDTQAFCLIAKNLQASTAAYYVANNGAGTTTAAASSCP